MRHCSLFSTIAILSGIAGGFCSSPLSAQKADSPSRGPQKQVLVTLDYEETDVRRVLNDLAKKGKLKLKIAPDVRQDVTVHIHNRRVVDALELVAELAELSARRVGEEYVVAPRDEMRDFLRAEGVARQVALTRITPAAAETLLERAFPDLTVTAGDNAIEMLGASEDLDRAELMIRRADQGLAPIESGYQERVKVNNISLTEAQRVLPKMLPGIQVGIDQDALVVSGTREEVETAKRRLAAIDIKDTDGGEMRVYSVRYAATSQLVELVTRAVKTVEVFAGPDSFLPSKPGFNPLSNTLSKGSLKSDAVEAKDYAGKKASTLLLRGTPAALDQAFKVLTLMDVAPTQMLIDVRILETSPEYSSNVGVNWTWNTVEFVERGKINGTGATPDIGPAGLGRYSRVPFNPSADINALIMEKKVKILANPQIAVLNDQDASIFIGDQVRFETLSEASPQTGSEFSTIETPIGIILVVHPRANDDGYITLRVQPVISELIGFTGTLPQNSVREADTSLRVHDGDTFVIGGLTRETTQITDTSVPLLGDIPLLGRFFRSHARRKNRTEVMVFLTVHIIK